MEGTPTSTPSADEPVANPTSDAASEAATESQNLAPAPAASEEPEAPSTETADPTADSDSEGFLGGKYKTKADFEKAFKELQRDNQSNYAERAELSRALNEVLAQPAPAEQQAEENPYDTPDPLTLKIQNLERQQSFQSYLLTHPELSDEDMIAMTQVIKEDPMVAQIGSPEAKLEYARMKVASNPKTVEAAKKQAHTQAVAKVAEKQAAQVESAGKATPTDENTELMEKATGNYGPKEREAARLALIKKNLVNL